MYFINIVKGVRKLFWIVFQLTEKQDGWGKLEGTKFMKTVESTRIKIVNLFNWRPLGPLGSSQK